MKLYDAKAIYIGDKKIKRMYVGDTLVYPKTETPPEPPTPVLPDSYRELAAIILPSRSTGITTQAKVATGFTAELYGSFNYATVSTDSRWFGLGSSGSYSHGKLVVGMVRGISSHSYNNYPFVVVDDEKTYADNKIEFSTLEDHIFSCKITTTPHVKVVLESQNEKDPTAPVITIDTEYQLDPQYMEEYFSDMYFGINPGSVLYSVKINSDVSYNMIPAQRKSDNVFGMFDLINQTFFTSGNSYPYNGLFS